MQEWGSLFLQCVNQKLKKKRKREKKRMAALTLGDWMRRVQALGPGTRERISLPEGGDDEQ